MAITEAQVQELLKQTIDPTTGKDYVSSKEIKKVQVSGGGVSVDVLLGYPAKSQLEVASNMFLDRFPEMRLADEFTPTWKGIKMRSVESLLVTL